MSAVEIYQSDWAEMGLTTIGKLLQRKRGVTSFEIIMLGRTTSPHSRLSELERAGWTISRNQVKGEKYFRYFGLAPKVGA